MCVPIQFLVVQCLEYPKALLKQVFLTGSRLHHPCRGGCHQWRETAGLCVSILINYIPNCTHTNPL